MPGCRTAVGAPSRFGPSGGGGPGGSVLVDAVQADEGVVDDEAGADAPMTGMSRVAWIGGEGRITALEARIDSLMGTSEQQDRSGAVDTSSEAEESQDNPFEPEE